MASLSHRGGFRRNISPADSRINDRLRKQEEDNASRLMEEIKKLKNDHWNSKSRNYREFWVHVKQISELFKTLKPLSQQDRASLWEEFGTTCEEAKKEKSKIQRQWEMQVDVSRQKRDLIEFKTNEARLQAEGAESHEELRGAKVLLQEAREWMKDGWGGFNAVTQIINQSDGRLMREDRDACFEKIRGVEDAIRNRREELWERDYQILKEDVVTVFNEAEYSDPKEAKLCVVKVRNDLKNTYLRRDRADELHELLNDAWNRAKQRLKEKYEAWVNKMTEHVNRWSEIIERKEQRKRNLEEQIERCEEIQSSATTEEFSLEVQGWIDGKLTQINEIDNQISELEEKIASVTTKIRD
jgi:hypothetical protein